jgi:hypothetical protein
VAGSKFKRSPGCELPGDCSGTVPYGPLTDTAVTGRLDEPRSWPWPVVTWILIGIVLPLCWALSWLYSVLTV